MSDLAFLQDYFIVITVAFCFLAGSFIKNGTGIDNKYIPAIVGILGLLFNIWVHNFAITPEIIVSGLASGWASVGLFEVTQILKREE